MREKCSPLLENGELPLPRGVDARELAGQAPHFCRQEALVLRGAQQFLNAALVLYALRPLLLVFSYAFTRTRTYTIITYVLTY